MLLEGDLLTKTDLLLDMNIKYQNRNINFENFILLKLYPKS